MLDRRAFLGTVGLLAAPRAAEAQTPGKVWRIGLLSSASPSAGADCLQAFKLGLRELAYVEGQNLAIEYRWAEGRDDRLAALAADLVRLKVDVIVTQRTLATQEARKASTTIPIIFAVAGDLVSARLVLSLTRPGGCTGVCGHGLRNDREAPGLLREVVPGMTRVAALWNSANAFSGLRVPQNGGCGPQAGPAAPIRRSHAGAQA